MSFRSVVTVPLILVAASHAAAQSLPESATKADSVGANPQVSGTVSVSGGATLSTVRSEKLTISGNLDRESNRLFAGPRHQVSSINLAGTYDSKKKKGGSAVITRSYTGWLQHLVYVQSDRLFISGNARFLHNNSLGVYLQQWYSLLGGYVTRSNGRVAELNAGPAFVGQHFIGSQGSTGFAAAELHESVSLPFRLFTPDTRISEGVRVALPLVRTDPWTGVANAELVIPLSANVSLNLTGLDYYVSNPPSGSEKNYLNFSLGLTIPFGN
jgi:hypothetical protein